MASSPVTSSQELLKDLSIRPVESSDLEFIRIKALQDLEKFWPFRANFDGPAIYKKFDKLFPKILYTSQVTVVAKGSGIVAFAAIKVDKPVVYLSHTNKAYRQLGLCRALLSGIPRPFTYCLDSYYAKKVAEKLGGTFDPFGFSSLEV